MAWSDAGQRLAAMPDAGTGRDFAVSNRLVVSTPATAACRCRYQSLTAGSLIYDHVSSNHSAHEGYATIVLLLWHGNKGHTEMLVRGEELVLDNSPRHE